MKTTLINKTRNEYLFELTSNEVIKRICKCLKPTNPTLKQNDIERCPNSKEYKAQFVNKFGEPTVFQIGIGHLKKFFGSRLIKLLDNGGMEVRRIVTQKNIRHIPLTKRTKI